MNIFKEIITPIVILLALDSLYLLMMKKPFANQIIQIQKTSMQMRYGGLIASYLLLFIGLWFFILRKHKPVMDAFILGLVIYGVYETTNYATLKNWDIKLVIGDTLWGGVLLGLTTLLTYKINYGHIFEKK